MALTKEKIEELYRTGEIGVISYTNMIANHVSQPVAETKTVKTFGRYNGSRQSLTQEEAILEVLKTKTNLNDMEIVSEIREQKLYDLDKSQRQSSDRSVISGVLRSMFLKGTVLRNRIDSHFYYYI